MTAPIRNDATEAQVRAADPQASTWLEANAGSGKTRVLTDRVARLLLGGVNPQSILCLTYTKAAASEMQNRLFERLGEWAMLNTEELRRKLTELGADGPLDDARLRDARTLFAQAIEAPGGLKIQTIHSFCAGILRRFPLEAGVTPQFTEMEDRAAELLQAEVVDDLAEGDHREIVAAVAGLRGENDLSTITRGIVGNRAAFTPAPTKQEVYDRIGAPMGDPKDHVVRLVFDGSEQAMLAHLPACLDKSKAAEKILRALAQLPATPDMASFEILSQLFLLKDRSRLSTSATTKKIRSDLGPHLDTLEAFCERLAQGHELLRACDLAAKQWAITRFAEVFVPEYERRKQMRGWLDYDDLITRTQSLLNNPSVAAWVLYKLDGGIDHVLVDEAQDTSPTQWDVVRNLVGEITSGEGARADTDRTIFVVGDKKQSIYSFQGADPREFDRMQEHFRDHLAGSGHALTERSLSYSFRTSSAILRVVDTCFAGQDAAGFPASVRHSAFFADMPGRVDLWEDLQTEDTKEDRHWYDPLDRVSPEHANRVLANRIAARIGQMCSDGTTLPARDGKTARRVTAGDFLILVRRRSGIFPEIIRACKAAGLPIAGADRLKVGAEVAVKDLAALLSFLATPEDDLSLATALRSPLFGWSEQTLFDLAHRRDKGRFLWTALRDRVAEFPDTMAILTDLLGQTDFLRPYDLIERILTRHDGRSRLVGRLGHEAVDGINALLGQALAYERSDIPSLTGFLVWMQTDNLEIKRQIDAGSDMIRVMTVHGAKGLEAPIVILPDTATYRRPGSTNPLVKEPGGGVFWRAAKDTAPAILRAAQEEESEAADREAQRLLYVAMTRAEQWLIVAAAGNIGKEDKPTWFTQISTAMQSCGAVEHDFGDWSGLRIETGDWSLAGDGVPEKGASQNDPLPDHLRAPPPDRPAPLATLAPSDLGGAKAIGGDGGQDEDTAKQFGTWVHLLLEHLPGLPAADYADAARALLPGATNAQRTEALSHATKVLSEPAIAEVLTRPGLSEVPISAPVGARRLHGTIDRLIINDDRVMAVDFKTNAVIPEDPTSCPEGILRQMGAYLVALQSVYPGRPIDIAVLWTARPALMTLPHDLVKDALARSPSLDGTDGAP